MKVTVIFSNKTGARLIIYWLPSCLTIAWHDWCLINVLSPCWWSILLTTTWHVWYTDEHVVTLLADHTILLPGRRPHINFRVSVLHLKIITSLYHHCKIFWEYLLCNNYPTMASADYHSGRGSTGQDPASFFWNRKNKCHVDDDGRNEDKDEQWNRGEACILYIIRLLAVRWAGSYNDNVLSALPWVP